MTNGYNIHREHFLTDERHAKINRYIEITAAYLNLWMSSDTHILDVGASDGEFAKHLKGVYRGIDIDPASSIVDECDIYHVSDIYDIVIFNHVLEHMPDTQSVLKRATELLKSQGLLFINVPIGDWAAKLPGHIALFNEEVLSRNVLPLGYELVEMSTHCFRGDCVELWLMYRRID